MEYVLELCCGIFVVESSLWKRCYGNVIVESVLCKIGCGIVVVESSSWNRCCGVFVVESLLLNKS